MGTWLQLELRRQGRRVLGLIAFGGIFMAAAAAARLLGSRDGHVEFDALMEIGGYTLVSALLLIGWLAGRFPVIAALVLTAGVFSDPRRDGLARLLEVRRLSPLHVYALRIGLALALALLTSCIVLPLFDIIMLGRLPGVQLFAVALADVLVLGTLTALLSTFTRADAWIALFLYLAAMVWHALLRSGILATAAPLVREAVTVLLPPQGALLRLEEAFAGDLAVPWAALLYAAVYGALALVIAGVVAQRREL